MDLVDVLSFFFMLSTMELGRVRGTAPSTSGYADEPINRSTPSKT
jgi:hypothetical protein